MTKVFVEQPLASPMSANYLPLYQQASFSLHKDLHSLCCYSCPLLWVTCPSRYPQLMSWRPEARIPQSLMGTIIENNFLGEKDEEHFPGYRWDTETMLIEGPLSRHKSSFSCWNFFSWILRTKLWPSTPKVGLKKSVLVIAFIINLIPDIKIALFSCQVAVCVNKQSKMQFLGVVDFKSSTLAMYWLGKNLFLTLKLWENRLGGKNT